MTKARSLSRIASALAAAALGGAFAGASGVAQAQVYEIDAHGRILVRDDAGEVNWSSPETRPRADQTSPDLPPAAVTVLDGSASPPAYRKSVATAAALAGISPALLEAVVWQESRWRPGAVSPVGAIGLGQLMPGTARQLGVDPRDPEQNLIGAARYLREQLNRFDHNIELALAAYNAGPGRVQCARAVPAIRETRDYVAAITGRLAARTLTN
ncbi:MAG: lytic transglycosylase domain-containing protein [Novosphingobium sp.]|nr:lytic transglycosylase domain-containing protein [Novosphingobium sp.]